MTPASHLHASLQILEDIDRAQRPADAIISGWFRFQRGLEDYDRGAILDMVNGVLRHRGRIGWWLERQKRPDTPRLRLLAYMILVRRKTPEGLERHFSGAPYAPEELTDSEFALLNKLQGHTIEHPDMPEEVRLECPDWAAEPLRRRFGEDFAAEMAALLDPPTLDLRVNTLRTRRADILRELKSAGLPASDTPLSPQGIRLDERLPLNLIAGLKRGEVEIQDEGSQLVALLLGAKPGDRVVDFCAGAGGKTLALAAQMANKGRIIACDINPARLKRAAERLRHAGVHNAETRQLSSETDKWVKRHKLSFDRVLIDAPCSGTGTWRRNPDARWRDIEGNGIEGLLALQARILVSASRLVKPGGRLVYATCSLLPEENEAQVTRFLGVQPEFKLVPLAEAAPPDLGLGGGKYLSLTPAQHQTDGFFAAVLERAALPAEEAPKAEA